MALKKTCLKVVKEFAWTQMVLKALNLNMLANELMAKITVNKKSVNFPLDLNRTVDYNIEQSFKLQFDVQTIKS